MYTEKTLRKKAAAAGYRIEKGFQRYTTQDCICPWRETGYLVIDLTIGFSVWGSYDQYYTHIWQLKDVESFLKKVYLENGLKW